MARSIPRTGRAGSAGLPFPNIDRLRARHRAYIRALKRTAGARVFAAFLQDPRAWRAGTGLSTGLAGARSARRPQRHLHADLAASLLARKTRSCESRTRPAHRRSARAPRGDRARRSERRASICASGCRRARRGRGEARRLRLQHHGDAFAAHAARARRGGAARRRRGAGLHLRWIGRQSLRPGYSRARRPSSSPSWRGASNGFQRYGDIAANLLCRAAKHANQRAAFIERVRPL